MFAEARAPLPKGEAAFQALIDPVSPEDFFRDIWQKKPQVFSRRHGKGPGAESGGSRQRPIVEPTWEDCCDMLAIAWNAAPIQLPDGCDLLMFHGQQLTYRYEEQGPCSALLNGASCVVNHAEYVWPSFSRLCLELRERLVHVYCNSYVTPPGCQAVPAHADDRDVFVMQLCGRKSWRVFGSPPVPLPYSDEQVGKNGLSVPPEVLASTPVIEQTLEPGDVLYMPRGYVHEAFCPDDVSSWHATLAVATHDWSWSKLVAGALASALDGQSSARWRAAVPLSLGTGAEERNGDGDGVQADLEELWDCVRKSVQVSSLKEHFRKRIENHNRLQAEASVGFKFQMDAFLEEVGQRPDQVWPFWYPCTLGFDTRVRRATPEESEDYLEGVAQAAARYRGKGTGKGKGKGKGCSLVVRDEAAAAASAALEALADRRGGCQTVRELGALATAAAQDCKSFDDLSLLCFARAAMGAGALRTARGSDGGYADDARPLLAPL